MVAASLLLFAQIGSVQFQTHVAPDTVYVGQQVTYDAITLVDDIARTRLRGNPEYTPPDVRGVTVYDFPFDSSAMGRVYLDGRTYERYSYKRAMFPLTAGEYHIPPATLRYSLPEADGFYAERQTYTASSLATRFVALPLPMRGRPLEFMGVVGQFSDTLFTDGSRMRVGHAFTLTIRVFGTGNIGMLPRPPLRIDWADVVAAEERVEWDSVGTVVRGAKEFDWVVTPRVAGSLFIPEVRYDYFDPSIRQYAAAVTPPLRAEVATMHAVDVDTVSYQSYDETPIPMLKRLVRENRGALVIGAILVVFAGIFLFVRRLTR